jgi:hypothetical protein
VAGSAHRSVAPAGQVEVPRTRREMGKTCTADARDRVSAAGAQAFGRREERSSSESTSAEDDTVAKSHPSYGWAPWGAGTSTSALASDSPSARGTLDTLGHQRWSARVAHAGMLDAALIPRGRTVLRGIEVMPFQQ